MRNGTNGFVLLLCLVCTVCASVAACSQTSNPQNDERHSILAALRLLFGEPLKATQDYVVVPTFSPDGLLISIAIKPKDTSNPADTSPLSRAEFDSLLAKIDSVKPLGQQEEDMGFAVVHGGRAWSTIRYQSAYLSTGEPITYPPPRPVQFANVYYLHPVAGVPKIPKDSKPQDAGSFGLICVGSESYIAPKAEFQKAWARPGQQQLFNLAGPTGDRGACTD